MPRTVTWLGGITWLAVGWTVVSPAHAHELPKGLALVWASDALEELPLIVTNRGLVFADMADGATRFSLRCSEAYDARISDRPSVFLDGAGALTIGMFHGVYYSTDRACTLRSGSGLPEQPIAKVARGADRTAPMFVASPATEGAALFTSTDDGLSWSTTYQSPVDEFYDTLIPVPSNAQALYASGVRIHRAEMAVSHLCSRSLDAGKTWQEHVHPTKIIPYAVHPQNPDVVFAYEPTDRFEVAFNILRSTDGCATFTRVLENILQPTGFTMTPDGTTAWVGTGISGMGGLYRSTDGGLHFEHVLADQVRVVSCLSYRQDRLWLCATMAPASTGVWSSKNLGDSFDKLLTFDQVREPVACEGDAGAVCDMAWNDFTLELHGAGDAGVGDAGASDAGTADAGHDVPAGEDGLVPNPGTVDAGVVLDAGDAAGDAPGDAGGCQAGRGRPASSGAWLAAASALLLALLRRRPRTR